MNRSCYGTPLRWTLLVVDIENQCQRFTFTVRSVDHEFAYLLGLFILDIRPCCQASPIVTNQDILIDTRNLANIIKWQL